MAYETHENGYLKNCLNCKNEITSLNPEHIYCTQCGFPVRNECTGTSKFHQGSYGDPAEHDIEDEEYLLDPNVVFCPKCSTISLFAQKGLIENTHPKVEVITSPPRNFSEDDDPFF